MEMETCDDEDASAGDVDIRDVDFFEGGMPTDMENLLSMQDLLYSSDQDCIKESVETWQDSLAGYEAGDDTAHTQRPPPMPTTRDSYSANNDIADALGHLEQDSTIASELIPNESLHSHTPLVAPRENPLSSLRVEIPAMALLTPRSFYEPFEPPAPLMSERHAVQALSTAFDKMNASTGTDVSTADFVEFRLDDFVVYCDSERFPQEMRSLHQLETKAGHKNFFFDGILSLGDTRAYVRHVPIIALPIDNYGALRVHTVRHHIWFQSRLNTKRGIYYKLGEPAREYVRFFDPFLWVADLAKHFVDFLKVMGDHKRKVNIYHFRSTFRTFLKKAHKEAPEFIHWLDQHPSEDFRTSIAANIAWLYKEAIGVLDYKAVYSHTIWSEIWDFQRYKDRPKPSFIPPTVVTQYMYDCFQHLPFGNQLKPLPMSQDTGRLRNRIIKKRHLEPPSPLHDSVKNLSAAPEERIKNISPGDTISTRRDEEGSGTKWKREIAAGAADADTWFALVQKVTLDRRGNRTFEVIWYYRPVDTLCGLMKYPWNNELFCSDHCSCSEKYKISEDEVLGVHDVDFGGTSATESELFCRQTYIHKERIWITLQPEHQQCQHTRPPNTEPKYQAGDTVLVHVKTNSEVSEPCEVVASFSEGGKRMYELRRLLRRKEVDPRASSARPNELVYSSHVMKARHQRVLGVCSVRFFEVGDEILTPYDRDGVGGFFYITHEQVDDGSDRGTYAYLPLETFPLSMKQGHDPDVEIPKLRGLDLFCGGGNFGRGLEDGGGIQMKWANDYDTKAIHTYMANAACPEDLSPFLGSIDDLQRLAIQGDFSAKVPRVGDVDFISGGSPCPGFSSLTNDKTTDAQRKNQSLVAAFGSFIDLYRPQYALLENVPGIVHKRANRGQDVFSQLICAIVGLGYQAQFFFLDASSCGSPQRRSRVFLVIAAPGFALPGRPLQTHSHPPLTKALGLGLLPTGEPMAERVMPVATPFKFVTAAEATADLPPIMDGKPDICVPFPDHRISLGVTAQLRNRIRLIPTRPWGSNFASAYYGTAEERASGPRGTRCGRMTSAERTIFPKTNTSSNDNSNDNRNGTDGSYYTGDKPMHNTAMYSNSFGRMSPHKLLETVVTTQNAHDGKNGRQLHWDEDRVMTIMEARRAQGFRDEDVLLGSPAAQYKIVGNSVAREVSVALGVVFREALVESLTVGRGRRDGVRAGVRDTSDVPFVIVDEASSSSESESVSPERSVSSGPTPATTLSPPPAAEATGQKRTRPQSTLCVEIFAPKVSKMHRDDTPRSETENRVAPESLASDASTPDTHMSEAPPPTASAPKTSTLNTLTPETSTQKVSTSNTSTPKALRVPNIPLRRSPLGQTVVVIDEDDD